MFCLVALITLVTPDEKCNERLSLLRTVFIDNKDEKDTGLVKDGDIRGKVDKCNVDINGVN